MKCCQIDLLVYCALG